MALVNPDRVAKVIRDGLAQNGLITPDYLRSSFSHVSLPSSEYEIISNKINNSFSGRHNITHPVKMSFPDTEVINELIEKISKAPAITPPFKPTQKIQKVQVIMRMGYNMGIQRNLRNKAISIDER